MQNKSPIYGIVIGAVCLVAAYFTFRGLTPKAPVLLAQAKNPSGFQYRDGAWFWMEDAGKPAARLIRAAGSQRGSIAAEDRLTAYSVSGGKVAWTGREGSRWSVHIASAEGSGMQTLWTGNREPAGICLAEDRVYWLETVPAVLPEAAALAPLGGRVNVVAVPASGGAPAVVAVLMEPEGKQVIGLHNGQLYVSAFRPGARSYTILYRVPVGSGIPYRAAAELNSQQAFLTRDGVLYWTADSPEAASSGNVACVRRLMNSGGTETLDDWMAPFGNLSGTGHGVYYVGPGNPPSAWRIDGQHELPKACVIPENYTVVAAGDNELLLKPADFAAAYPIYRMALP